MYCGSSFHRTNWLYASDHAARPLCGLQITTLHCHQPKYRQQMLAHSHGLYSILTLIICHFHPLPSCSCLLLHNFFFFFASSPPPVSQASLSSALYHYICTRSAPIPLLQCLGPPIVFPNQSIHTSLIKLSTSNFHCSLSSRPGGRLIFLIFLCLSIPPTYLQHCSHLSLPPISLQLVAD